MSKPALLRRSMLGASALGAASAAVALADPGQAAAQAVGVKKADLPDLAIKEVKVYVADIANVHRLNTPETGEIVSIVTNSGIEGNMTIGNRGNPPGFLEYAKRRVLGKSALDVTSITPVPNTRRFTAYGALTAPRRGDTGRNYMHDAIIDVCLWDILGKAVNRPIYQLLGGTKTRVMAYATSQHMATVEEYAPDVLRAKAAGLRGYKIHPDRGQPGRANHLSQMEEIRQVRKAAGDDYTLMFDASRTGNLYSALKIGRLLDDLGYISYEDPIPSEDIESLIVLARALDVPLTIGEYLLEMNSFADYIKRDALDIVRIIADNIGGITGGMRVGQLADAFGLEFQPHNWGNVMDMAVAFQIELASNTNYWFEMPWPVEYSDRVYIKHRFRVDQDGYINAPAEPGLGYPIDRDALDKIMIRIDR